MGLLSTLGTIGGSLLGGAFGSPSIGGAIGGALGGAIEGDKAADVAASAAAQTAAATDRAAALQREMWLTQQAQQKPWLEAGKQALNKLIPIATEYTPFGMREFQADPGYGFRIGEGMKALERSAAARGGLLSGATLKGIQRYGQDLASQEYQNAFNRYQSEREARLKPLQSLADVAQTSTNTLGAAGRDYASNVGNYLINQGYAAGNAQIAAERARQSMYGNINTGIGQITPSLWSSAGSALSNWYSNLGK